MRILRAAGRAAAPWSNGGGVTREIAVHPPGAGWDGFAWRVSLADVTRDGPYSPLPGVRRILTVVDGAGLELTVDGTPWLLPGRYRPFAFPGDATTVSRLLDGPVVNLNVMLREGRAAATVEVVAGSWSPEREPEPYGRVAGGLGPAGRRPDLVGGPDPAGGLLLVALEGGARLTVPGESGESEVRLERFDAVLWTGSEALPDGLRTDSTVAVVRLSGPPLG
ncbi:HutD/Ves family protein [Streptomyces auratus]|uniref:HutD family protein n=1 Tax=Streptomyces auratus AGR0001 TaxID=1160718 RepID=J2K4C0_9ACTN|nr:HutD family protein [Streptomyces auratus]QTZ94069.1 HutD family protein [Streptomyces auratus AGR0001]